MNPIKRHDVHEEHMYSGVVEVGDFVYCSFCVGNVGQSVEQQINGAFDHMADRLQLVGLTLEHVVKIDVLFRDVWNIPILEQVIKRRFKNYPARKVISTDFAHIGGPNGLEVQIDCVAYRC